MTEVPLKIPTRRYWSGANSDEKKINTLALLQRLQLERDKTPSLIQALPALEQAAGEIKRLQEAITAVRRLAQNIEDHDLRIQIISACSDG
jgi:hypothetical protein